MRVSSFTFYFLGVGFMGGVIGLLTGISASPVVGVLIPLLFGLITAGGGIYVIAGGKPGARSSSMSDAWERGRFLGLQMSFFSVVFLVGLWFGVAAKFHSDLVWLTSDRTTSTFEDLVFDDMRILAAFIELDTDMKRAGASKDKRLRILSELQEGISARAEKAGSDGPTAQDIAAALIVIGEPGPDEAEDGVRWWDHAVAWEPFVEKEEEERPDALRDESANS